MTTYNHKLTKKQIIHVFALAYLRGYDMHFFCPICRSEVTRKSHPIMCDQLIEHFNNSVSQKVLISQRKLKPSLICK